MLCCCLLSQCLRSVDFDARTGLCTFGPTDHELVVGAGLFCAEFNQFGVGDASRTLLSFGSLRSRGALVALVTLRALTTRFTLGSLQALRAPNSFRSAVALRTSFAFHARGSFVAGRALVALEALQALGSFMAGRALVTLVALFALGTLRTHGAGHALEALVTPWRRFRRGYPGRPFRP